MDIFEKLGTERQFGFSLGPIPHSAVKQFALEEGLSQWELWEIVKELDAIWRIRMTPKTAATGDRDGRLSDQNLRGPIRRGRRKSDSDEGS